MSYYNRVIQAAGQLNSRLPGSPKVGVMLGSGLGTFAELLKNQVAISYADLPEFPTSTVEGHAGRFVYGMLGELPILAMQGRFHYYEGYSMEEVTMPIRVMHTLGIKRVVITNASGGVNPDFRPGNIMLITDHINRLPNPLIGPNEPRWGPRFPDMHEPYSLALRTKAKASAEKLGIALVEGCYLGTTGPSFETPHEYNFFRVIGADAVGMSTVPEVIVARHCGMEVLGFSLIANVGGLHVKEPVSHEEVQEEGAKAADRFNRLLGDLLPTL